MVNNLKIESAIDKEINSENYTKEELLDLLFGILKSNLKKINEKNFEQKIYLFKILDYIDSNYLDINSNLVKIKYNYNILLKYINSKLEIANHKRYLKYLKNMINSINANMDRIKLLELHQKTKENYNQEMEEFYQKMNIQLNEIQRHKNFKIDQNLLIAHYQILLKEIMPKLTEELISLDYYLNELIKLIDKKIIEIEHTNHSDMTIKYLNELKNLILKTKKEIKIKILK